MTSRQRGPVHRFAGSVGQMSAPSASGACFRERSTRSLCRREKSVRALAMDLRSKEAWRPRTSKSLSQWSRVEEVRMAMAAMRQSISLLTVSPCRRHERYSAAASSKSVASVGSKGARASSLEALR
jgi:hypothetical protein